MQNVYLIGMMGSGKSTVGMELARKLGSNFVDTDREIEKMEGCSIIEIFASHGEQHFRNLEGNIIRKLYDDFTIVATGGGSILREENRDWMRSNGIVVYLQTTPSVLEKRIIASGVENRPKLQSSNLKGKIQELSSARHFYYGKTAHIVINTDNENHNGLSQKIAKILKG